MGTPAMRPPLTFRPGAYGAWLSAQAEADAAFRAWAAAALPQRRERQLSYRAALDREGRAATLLAAALRAPAKAA
jgi:hypothetical protein